MAAISPQRPRTRTHKVMADICDMSLWTLNIVPKKASKYEIEQITQAVQYVHVTNVSLGLSPEPGWHTLTVEKDGQEIVVARLNRDTHPQHTLDFVLDQTVVFRNHGSTNIHLLGYETTSMDFSAQEEGEDSEDEDEDMDFEEEEDEDEEDEDEDEDEDAPLAVPIANGQVKPKQLLGKQDGNKKVVPIKVDSKQAAQPVSAKKNAAAAQLPIDSDEDEEDEDDDEEFPMSSNDMVMELAEGEDDDEDEDEDEDEEDENEEHGMFADDDEEGEEEEGEEEEGEEDEDEDEEEEEGEKTPQPAAKAGTKRMPASMTLTPQVTKKAKGADGLPKVPATAPPKQAAGKQAQQAAQPKAAATPGAKPSNEKEYEKAIVDYLRSQPDKTVPMSKLGSAVHKPDGVPKLGQWIKNHTKLFAVVDNGQKVKLLQ